MSETKDKSQLNVIFFCRLVEMNGRENLPICRYAKATQGSGGTMNREDKSDTTTLNGFGDIPLHSHNVRDCAPALYHHRVSKRSDPIVPLYCA